MASQATAKRPASDAALDQEQAQTLPPAQRQPQFIDLTTPAAPDMLPHVAPSMAASTAPSVMSMPSAASVPITTADALQVLEEVNMSDLQARLDHRSDAELNHIIMALASNDSRLRTRIQNMVSEFEKEELEEAGQEEERQRRAEEEMMITPLDFHKLIDRVDKYMNKPMPRRWNANREMEEVYDVSYSIGEIFEDIASRCCPLTPSEIKMKSLSALVEMLGIIIDSPGSELRRHCVNDYYSWQGPFAQVWQSLDLRDQYVMATMPAFVDQVNKIGVGGSWYRGDVQGPS